MLDINITLWFQLANFLIALVVLNHLLIRPIRELIKKRNGIMDEMSGEAETFEGKAAKKLARYEEELARARREAVITRDMARTQGAVEQQQLLNEARKDSQDILTEAGRALQVEADQALKKLRKQVGTLSTNLTARILKS